MGRRAALTLSLLLAVPMAACEDASTIRQAGAATPADARLTTPAAPNVIEADAGFTSPAAPNVVEVVALGRSFEGVPETIPAGWTTFRLRNEGGAIHFLIIEKMPAIEGEQKTVEDSEAEVVPVFQNIMDDIDGKGPSFPEAGFDLPSWYGDVTLIGGPGLISAGRTAQTTVHLEPGTYVVECYVKDADGTFHSTDGMIAGLTVTEEASGAYAPGSSAELTLSYDEDAGTGDIAVEGELRPGLQTIALRFADQSVHEHYLGHDVHLVRLEEGTEVADVAAWMSWATPGGLASPAPADFLGGAQDMPAGSLTYVTVRLEPGRHAWIAEVPDPVGKGLVEAFTVPEDGPSGR